jgi:hypothetical protein
VEGDNDAYPCCGLCFRRHQKTRGDVKLHPWTNAMNLCRFRVPTSQVIQIDLSVVPSKFAFEILTEGSS